MVMSTEAEQSEDNQRKRRKKENSSRGRTILGLQSTSSTHWLSILSPLVSSRLQGSRTLCSQREPRSKWGDSLWSGCWGPLAEGVQRAARKEGQSELRWLRVFRRKQVKEQKGVSFDIQRMRGRMTHQGAMWQVIKGPCEQYLGSIWMWSCEDRMGHWWLHTVLQCFSLTTFLRVCASLRKALS